MTTALELMPYSVALHLLAHEAVKRQRPLNALVLSKIRCVLLRQFWCHLVALEHVPHHRGVVERHPAVDANAVLRCKLN